MGARAWGFVMGFSSSGSTRPRWPFPTKRLTTTQVAAAAHICSRSAGVMAYAHGMHHQGVSPAITVRDYQVTITYAEPTYARARGIDEILYVGVFHVSAADPEHAITLATDLFREAQRSSGVSWAREIRSVTWRLSS
jgi:hypothetical protein